ncbi:hypothetical protein GR160_16275 [Flavobacterium sp. Sd200]|uniref:hypothetical protein n=1 Tax=Flavobacterium sp. Sd200 TaxID=2692211 RepID=UPI00136DDC8E|nr:hypothetical protein [Flavobacterium sp. Sd200]MXN92786.1 hypothetical protein [Flavobacterium sp. Sd200]
MKPTLIVLFFVALATTAQTGKNCNNLWLKVNYTGAEQAGNYKKKALKLLGAKTVHDTVKAKAYNTLGIYAGLTGKHDSAVIFYQKAHAHLKKYPQLQIYTCINEAASHEALTNYSISESIGQKALALNNKYGNATNKALIYHALSSAYLRMDKLEKATEYLINGIDILEKQKDNCYLWLLKLSLATAYIQTNNYKFATDIFEAYLQNNAAERGTKRHTIAIVNYTECLIELGQHDKAYTLLNNAVKDVAKLGDRELEGVLYYRIANLEYERGHTEASLQNYEKAYSLLDQEKSRFTTNIYSGYLDVLVSSGQLKKALGLAKKYKNTTSYKRSVALERLAYQTSVAELYEKAGLYKDQSLALQEALRICDSVRQINNGYSEQQVQAGYQNKFQRERNMLLAKNNVVLKNKLATEERLLYMYIIASVAVIILILLYLRSYRLRNHLQKEKLKNAETDKAFIEQQRIHQYELLTSQKNTIEEKQREATSIALQLANYYDHLNELIEKCNTTGYTTANDIKKELQQLVKQKDYWKQFEARFNDLNPEFAGTLMNRYPRLTKNDLEFCSLLKLKLSYKEIASLLQISHESVITKKYRVRKKMELKDEVELEKMLDEM